MYKGPNQCMAKLNDFDQIQNYIDSRYVSATEAFWKIKSFSIHGNFPKVSKLPVHLKDLQNVNFKTSSELKLIIDLQKKTKLIAWMESNKKYPHYRHLTYMEYPKYFQFDTKDHEWKLRSRKTRGKVNLVVRMYRVEPYDKERFYLRLILKYKPGAISYDDLLTVNEKRFNSFLEVAKELNLLETDDIWYETITEAISILNPYKCRKLFILILINGMVISPKNFWDRFKEDLYADFKFSNAHLTTEQLENKTLEEFRKQLEECNSSFQKIRFPIKNNQTNFLNNNKLAYVSNSFSKTNFDKSNLTNEQLIIFNAIFSSIQDETKSKLFFVDAFGGSGKTYLFNTIIKEFECKNLNVLAVAHSGIAAILLKGGRTAHSLLKIPIDIEDDDYAVCNINLDSELAKKIRNVDLIIWDEATMSNKAMFECLNTSLNDICDTPNKLFGNKIVLMGGDFRQTLPIVKHGTKADIIKNCIKSTFF